MGTQVGNSTFNDEIERLTSAALTLIRNDCANRDVQIHDLLLQDATTKLAASFRRTIIDHRNSSTETTKLALLLMAVGVFYKSVELTEPHHNTAEQLYNLIHAGLPTK